MGAASAPSRPACRAKAASMARSMAARSIVVSLIASFLDDVEAPIGLLDEASERPLDLGQLLVRVAQEADPFVEQLEGLSEVELRIVQLPDDLLETGHLLFE